MARVTISDNKGVVVSQGKHLVVEGMPLLEELEEITVPTGTTATLKSYGQTSITTTGGASGVITLPNGEYVGQLKLIVLTDDGGDAAVTVSKHVTSDDEVFTAEDTADALLLVWMGNVWATVANNGWAT